MGLFDNLKKSLILKKVKSNSVTRTIKILPIQNYKSILLIFDTLDDTLVNQLKNIFTNATLFTLSIRKNKDDDSIANNYTYHISDVGFGKIKNERLQQLLNTNFDAVLDFSNKNTDLDYFVQASKSTLKIGDMYASKNYLYDLLVDNINSKHEFVDNIKRQINILSQK